jgi:threonine dehydrogenase-like Zn-dependent dehydrogenase
MGRTFLYPTGGPQHHDECAGRCGKGYRHNRRHRIGVIGVFVPQDPHADDKLIHFEKAKPSVIVSHELALMEAPDAYKHFDNRDRGWTKVVLHPHAA